LKRPVELPPWLTFHWGWLFAASIVEQALRFHWHKETGVIVVVLWPLVQASWLKTADMRSKAIYWNVAIVVLNLVNWTLDNTVRLPDNIDTGLGIATAAASIGSIFVFRSEMQRYFNDIDDVDLRLSPWMTLFFSTLYFQYQFHDIAEFKKRHATTSEAAG
jgi:hypothetical protein